VRDLAYGDLAGAEAKLEKANQRGPHWADPLKASGDVLVKHGHTQEALAKYDEALQYAPNWVPNGAHSRKHATLRRSTRPD
jgi:predicted negative regulator of RcsB-dependent stress response